MITRIFFLLVGLFLFSCSPIIPSQILGRYESSKKDSETTIVFMADKKFTFKQKNMGIVRSCTGNWELRQDGKLNLKCDDQSKDLEQVLSSGYMDPLNEEVQIKGKRKIKMGNLILIRKKE